MSVTNHNPQTDTPSVKVPQSLSTTPSAKAVGHTAEKIERTPQQVAQFHADMAKLGKVAHTALPWQAEEHPNPGFGLDITTADETICQHIENPANAAFIVRACNSHYQLLSALKAASSSLHSILSTAYELSADQLSLACKECGALSPRNRDKSSFRTIHNAQCRTETAIRAEAEAEQAIAQAEGGI